MKRSWLPLKQSFGIRPSIRAANLGSHRRPGPIVTLRAGHWPLLHELLASRVDTWAFPESMACSPWRTICRTCMHYWHSKIKIFPLLGTQQPFPHRRTLQLGITWRPDMNPRTEISQLELNLTERNTFLGFSNGYILRLSEPTFSSAVCMALGKSPLCLSALIWEMDVRTTSTPQGS